MTSRSLTESLRETLAVFDGSGTPRTTTEVADSLDLGRRSTYDRLDRLVEEGELDTKKVGASARVWWRPRASSTDDRSAATGDRPAPIDSLLDDALEGAEVGAFVLDENFEVVWIDDAIERYFGLDRERVLGRDKRSLVEERIAPAVEDGASFADTVLATYEENASVERFECRVAAGKGRDARWLEHRSKPIESGAYAGGRIELYEDVTEWKRTDHGSAIDRTQFESLVDAVEEYAIFMLGPDGHVRTWNAGAEQIKGYAADDVLGEHVSTFYTDSDREAGVPQANLTAAADEGSIEDEGWRVRADGSRFWATVTLTAIRDDDGDLRGYAKVTRDMTDRREREREVRRDRDLLDRDLEKYQNRYRTLVEHFPNGAVALVDQDLRYITFGGAPEGETDVTRGDLEGAPLRDALPREIADVVVPRYEAALDGEISEFEDTIDDRVYRFHFIPVRDDDGDVFAAIGMSQDITEQKEHERKLEESEYRYQTLVDNFPNGIVALFDEDFRYLIAGGELYEAFDVSPDDTIGKTLYDRGTAEEIELLEPHYRAALNGDTRSFEVEYAGRTLQFWVVPVTDESGEVFAGMAMSQDVTERKERERELERQREQLAALNDLNAVVRSITDEVIARSTREEIERVVCEHLAAAESYLFAWIGDVDVASQTVSVRTEAGVEGYLDGITISADPDDERSKGPTGRAILEQEIQTTNDIRADTSHDPWRSHVEEHGFRSSAAIPIVHEGTVYGVLNVYAERPNAFEGQERAVISQLGEVVGHAIAATERKQALMSDEVVELQFRIRDVFGALDVGVPTTGTITLDHTVPIEDDEYLVYGSATPDAVDSVRALVDTLPHWLDVTFRTDRGTPKFELRLSEPPVLSTVASLGGSVENVVIEDGDYRMTLHVAPGSDVRNLIDAVQSAYPAAELLKHRQITRQDDTAERVRQVLTTDLTDRQRATLEAAYHAGFFEWPRDASGEAVAESLDIAPATFHQHLRKAQQRVFRSLLSTPEST